MKHIEYVIIDVMSDGKEYEVERLSGSEYTKEQALARYHFHQDTKGGDHHLYRVTTKIKREHLAG